MLSRRRFLSHLAAIGPISPEIIRPSSVTIDRRALVARHSPALRQLDSLSPLSLGNGEFAFTADVTGLQTFPREYERAMPLCTMAQWGWHTSPLPSHLDPRAFRLTPFAAHGREVGYAISEEGQSELYHWLRENPHRLHLGRIGLRLRKENGEAAGPADLEEIEQRLELWSGWLTSRFRFEGSPVSVRTTVHPSADLLAVEVESPLLSAGRLAIDFAFPYGSPGMSAADWEREEAHRSSLAGLDTGGAEIRRKLDDQEYIVAIKWSGRATLVSTGAHAFVLSAERGRGQLAFVAAFARERSNAALPETAATFAASAAHWQRFWTEGGAIELAASRDRRAAELERRIVLSQYLTAIQCAGSLPPQETGLTVNSWYGKFHLEMHWWHAAHFAPWNRLPLLERSLGYYERILPGARERARAQGYAGARWPKMAGPEGRDSPSPIGPLLIWQQPHPIFYAEMCYLARPSRATLERYRKVVFESAEFMASYAFYDSRDRRYVLGPPLIPAQENHPPQSTWNPTYELAYWAYGLRIAGRWRERLGLARRAAWDRVLARLAKLPVRDGVYLAHENCPETFTARNYDHPSMLGALGVLPGDGVDRATMRRTLGRALSQWQWDRTWGWDYPLTALTAARLGAPELAVDALLMETEKNRYLPNGHNYQRANLPCYLPGNGGLLYAAALMAWGWRGAARTHAPGFPADGRWTVRAERFNRTLLARL
jgi:hypothetical protein